MNYHKGLMLLLLAAVFAMPAFGQEEVKKENWLEKRFGKELVNAKGEKVATATLKNLSVNKGRNYQKLVYIISCVLKVTVTLNHRI